MQTTALGSLTLCLLPLAAASPQTDQTDQTDVAEGAPTVEVEVSEVDRTEHGAQVIVLEGPHGLQEGQRVIWVERDGEQVELDGAGRVRIEIEHEDEPEQSFGARVRRGVHAIAGRRAGGARGWAARLADEFDDALELDIDIEELAEQIERQLEGLFEREPREVEMRVMVEVDDDGGPEDELDFEFELDDALELDIDIDELAEQIERQLEGLFEREPREVEMHVTVEVDQDGAHEDRWEYELEFDDDRSDRGIAGWLGRLFNEEEEEEDRRGRNACEACGCDERIHQGDAARGRGGLGWRALRRGQRLGAGRRAIPLWSEHYRDSQPGPLAPVFPRHDRAWTNRAPHPMGPDGPHRRQVDRLPFDRRPFDRQPFDRPPFDRQPFDQQQPAPWGPDRGGSEHFRGAPPEGDRAPQPMDGWEQTRRELDALRRQLDELRHMLEVR